MKWNQSMQSAGAIAPTEITLPLRPGRLREMNSKHVIGRAESSPGNEFMQSAGAEAKADWSPNDKQIKNTIPFLLLFKLTPLFGNALIRYSDLTFTYKKKQVAF